MSENFVLSYRVFCLLNSQHRCIISPTSNTHFLNIFFNYSIILLFNNTFQFNSIHNNNHHVIIFNIRRKHLPLLSTESNCRPIKKHSKPLPFKFVLVRPCMQWKSNICMLEHTNAHTTVGLYQVQLLEVPLQVASTTQSDHSPDNVEIPDNSMTFPWRFAALLPKSSVTYIMPVLVLLSVVGGKNATVQDPKPKWNAQTQQSQEWMLICG